MRVLLNDAEFDALTGLAYVVQSLYVMAIRPRMDYVTGMVGISRFISWQALREWLYIEPKPGIKGGSPHREAVRRMARQLEGVGLVKIRSNACNAQLIFKLPLASLYSHVQNKADIKPTPETDRGLQRESQPKADMGKRGKADTHLSTTVPTDNHHHITEYPAVALLWPNNLTPEERSAMLALLKKHKCNGSSQLLVDELAGVMQTKSVSNKVGYLRTIIERSKSGEFVAEKAHRVQAARENATRQLTAVTQIPTDRKPRSKNIEQLIEQLKLTIKKPKRPN